MSKDISKYDEEPVEYCSNCLSLAIKDDDGFAICQQCKNDTTKIAEDIFIWEDLFEERYKVKYLDWE